MSPPPLPRDAASPHGPRPVGKTPVYPCFHYRISYKGRVTLRVSDGRDPHVCSKVNEGLQGTMGSSDPDPQLVSQKGTEEARKVPSIRGQCNGHADGKNKRPRFP